MGEDAYDAADALFVWGWRGLYWVLVVDDVLRRLLRELKQRHGCRVVILYGSRARGDASRESDYDVAAFGPRVKQSRLARLTPEGYLDVALYPESMLARVAEDLLQMKDGVVLMDRDRRGERFVRALRRFAAKKPNQLSASDKKFRRLWAEKMLMRAGRGDDEGRYRQTWLLFQLLEDYFQLRGRRYEGAKAGLIWLERHDGATHRLYAAALSRPGDIMALRRLARRVMGTTPLRQPK